MTRMTHEERRQRRADILRYARARWGNTMGECSVMGRAWFFDTGDPARLDIWEYALEPMTGGRQSGAEWCREHLCEAMDEGDLRQLLEVPQEGNFQVLFKGTMEGALGGSPMDQQEWDEWFDLEESKCEPIPAEYMKFLGDEMPVDG